MDDAILQMYQKFNFYIGSTSEAASNILTEVEMDV